MHEDSRGREQDDAVRKDAIALFKFLREFTALRSKTIRSIDQYDTVLWLSDVPREAGVACAAWEQSRETDLGDTWLEIMKPKLPKVPAPPGATEPWLDREQLRDSSLDLPELRSQISRRIEDGDGEPQYETLELEDHPEISAAWDRYIEEEWWPWREVDRQLRPVHECYSKLYAIHQRQQRLGEQYEAVLGLGLLRWRTPDSQEIRRHLIVAQTSVHFDPVSGTITVGPAGEGANLRLEQDMLEPSWRPDPDESRAIETQIMSIGDDGIWDGVGVRDALQAWVNATAAAGTYSSALNEPAGFSPDPVVHLSPALVLRKRTARSFLKAFDDVLTDLEEGAAVPFGVERYVTVAEEAEGDHQEDPSDAGRPAEIPPQLYFPLETNAQQSEIVERLRSNQGVLVQGPPGTGKSHTIVNLVCHLMAEGKRVLVTSHAPRALTVLRRYIAEKAPEIAPLAVVLLGNDRESLNAMERSVEGITQRHSSWDAAATERDIDRLEQQLSDTLGEAAECRERLRSIREAEIYQHQPMPGAYAGTLQRIARRLRQEEESFEWFEDRPPSSEQQPPLTSTEMERLLALARDPVVGQVRDRTWKAVDASRLRSAADFSGMVARARAAEKAVEETKDSRAHEGFAALRSTTTELRQDLSSELGDLVRRARGIERHIHGWAGVAVRDVLGDRDRAWQELLDVTKARIEALQGAARWADENPVSGLDETDLAATKADAAKLLGHLEGGGRWGFGPFRAGAVKDGMYLQKVRVAGKPCVDADTLRDLIKRMDFQDELDRARSMWLRYVAIDSALSGPSQIAELEDLCEPLEAALELLPAKRSAQTQVEAIRGLAQPVWHDIDALEGLRLAAGAVDAASGARIATEQIETYGAEVASLLPPAGEWDPESRRLLAAIDAQDADGYSEALATLGEHYDELSVLAEGDSLATRLAEGAPKLAASIKANPTSQEWSGAVGGLEAAWNWARTRRWLAERTDPSAEIETKLRLDGIRQRERRLLGELASLKAWSHCFDRMTEHERQHLVAWALATKNVGKGTGKYAPKHRRAARANMNECRGAIPAWIMPLYRVAESITPGRDKFDVAIIDEASQSGPEALLLTYLADKLVVVGDDRQIAPNFIGVNRADVDDLRERYIRKLPMANQYGAENSFFELADIRYPGRIRLREHYRCMPEIIQFSNNLSYSNQPLEPLRQYGAGRLEPVVANVHVADGFARGRGSSTVNPREAEALVQRIVEYSAYPDYDNKTFGVISLLGSSQARLIEGILFDELGPEEMTRRQIVCGDAYAFQGDERDVMFLSLVAAPGEGRRIHALTSRMYERIFNVAASRARDQMLLFHTATLNDLNPNCMRHRLLSYCSHPGLEQPTVGGHDVEDLHRLASADGRGQRTPPEPFDSWFEVDVFLRIADAGFRVLPQYAVSGYRIDMVVEGMERRLAVECDGDEWHGAERYLEDMQRQRQLERCGFPFWRLRGSAFELDPDKAMKSLWEALDHHGISPGHVSAEDGDEEAAAAVPEIPDSPPDFVLRPPSIAADLAEPKQAQLVSPIPIKSQAQAAAHPADEEPAGHPLPVASRQAQYVLWVEWTMPDPRVASAAELAEGIVSVVEAEGPVRIRRVFQLLTKAAGLRRVRRLVREGLERGLNEALREGLVEEHPDPLSSGRLDAVLIREGRPTVIVRPAAGRSFAEIPSTELKTVVREILAENPAFGDEAIMRAAMAHYEFRRLTANMKSRMLVLLDGRCSTS